MRHWHLGIGAMAMLLVGAGLGAQQTPPVGQAGQRGAGPGGPGPVGTPVKLVPQFDKDGDGRLNKAERTAAREHLAANPPAGPGGRGGRGGRGGTPLLPPPEPGVRLTAGDVRSYPAAPFYDLKTLRTLFLEFEDDEWEAEMAAFNNTDVEVPATLRADGRTYPDVGVHFRGASSFFTVQDGYKRSINIDLDFVDDKQTIGGYTTLNLLNSHTDPTFLRSVLYLQIAREYMPAPKANYVLNHPDIR